MPGVKGLVLGLALGVVATACAGPSRGTKPNREPASHMTAARIYTLAEQQVAAGKHAEAVQLIRHALLQLPERPGADALRHKLVLRLAYVQLLAYEQTRDAAFVEDAQRMLERYLVKHEALFGDDGAARTERGDVYEILYVVETQREAALQPEAEPAPRSTHDEHDDESEAPVDIHAGEVVEDQMHRRVVVKKRSKLAQPDDPRVRERLESTFSDAEVGLVLTTPGIELVHGPRPLVRARRAPSAVGADSPEHDALARRLGRELLVEARPELRRCYEAAFARRTIAVTEGTVEASILPDGTVAKARIVEGGLVDALGDVCLIERIEAARVAADTTRSTTRVRLPLLFFYEGPVYINEGTGEMFRAPLAGAASPAPRQTRGLPPIDSFAR
jgi:hypothetical protein